MKLFLAALVAAAAVGCTSAPRWKDLPGETDYGGPFGVVMSQYAVPVAMGLARPGSVGGWDEKPSLREFVHGWTYRPRANDVDNDFVNYVLHPLAGSETHVIARSHGWSFFEAFLFDCFGSVTWEYVFENVFERPSLTDLKVTAPIGAIIGEIRWQATRGGLLPSVTYEPFAEFSGDEFVFGVEQRW